MSSKNQEIEVLPASAEVVIINHRAKTTSLAIAKAFDKNHADVLRSIRNIECSECFRLSNFAESSYLNQQGKEQPMYEMTRDGAVFLIMGYTGKEAARFKEAYINAFNRMEAELHGIWREAAETGYQKALTDIQTQKRIKKQNQAVRPVPLKISEEINAQVMQFIQSHEKFTMDELIDILRDYLLTERYSERGLRSRVGVILSQLGITKTRLRVGTNDRVQLYLNRRKH
jgi:Rha family phage regulatory protein